MLRSITSSFNLVKGKSRLSPVANLVVLDEYVWIRPSKETISTYDEIETSEMIITAQELSVCIRGLSNEYSRFSYFASFYFPSGEIAK